MRTRVRARVRARVAPRLASPLAAVALALVVAGCGLTGRGSGAASRPDDHIPTARRVRVDLSLGRASVAITDDTLPFTLRLTNTELGPVRVDFTGEPLYPRGPREKLRLPALWYSIERDDVASAAGNVAHYFATRDTVLAPGQTMEVPVSHSLRSVGMSPGMYRMRAGIGQHVSDWVPFTVTP